MTHTYVFKKCLDCDTDNLAADDRCWYCGGENLEERAVEWQEPEPAN